MIPGFHGFDLVIILIIALLIFGPKKLPEMGSAIGKSIKEFRKGMNELTQPKEEEEPKLPAATTTTAPNATQMNYSSVPYEGEIATRARTAQPVTNDAPNTEAHVE
jgi:sec-independent protein translocase protein TatA